MAVILAYRTSSARQDTIMIQDKRHSMDTNSIVRAPFPYAGGKSRVAPVIWQRFGDVENFVEPFAGSLAVLLARPTPGRIETVNDADALLCVGPSTRMLRSDLRWINAGDVRVSDELIGFDESNGEAREGLRAPKHYRHWCNTIVTAVRTIKKPCYRLTFSDGTTVVASSDHQWLGGSHKSGSRGWRWQRTGSMVIPCGNRRGSSALKLCDVIG